MLTATSPSYLHALQNLALILTSLFFLPLSTIILLLSYALHPRLLFHYNARYVLRASHPRRPSKSSAPKLNGTGQLLKSRRSTAIERRSILVTGAGMNKGLHIARAFHLAHHRVIGADSAPYTVVPPIGRFSRAIDKFYTLPLPTEREGSDRYIQALLDIILRENISLWVSCSGVASALDDARAQEIVTLRAPSCTCIQFDLETTQLLHEKDTFISQAASFGLPVPATHKVTTRAAVHKVLHESPSTRKKYIMKSVNMDDASRAEINTLLPRRTWSETYEHLARMPINDSNPYVLQQYVKGNREYCTHSLVIRGKVKGFVACPSSELLMHYEALSHPESALSRAMLRFTEEFAARSQRERTQKGRDFTGHLSFDFLIEERVTERGVENVLQAIECNPRCHTAVALFQDQQSSSEMVQAYLSALSPEPTNPSDENPVTMNGTHSVNGTPPERAEEEKEQHHPPVHPSSTILVYWLAHDLITLLLHPLLHLLLHPSQWTNSRAGLSNITTFMTHLLCYHDGAYETWDPLPAFVLYHVYWPGIFMGNLVTGKRWSRVNVSTGKVFGC